MRDRSADGAVSALPRRSAWVFGGVFLTELGGGVSLRKLTPWVDALLNGARLSLPAAAPLAPLAAPLAALAAAAAAVQATHPHRTRETTAGRAESQFPDRAAVSFRLAGECIWGLGAGGVCVCGGGGGGWAALGLCCIGMARIGMACIRMTALGALNWEG